MPRPVSYSIPAASTTLAPAPTIIRQAAPTTVIRASGSAVKTTTPVLGPSYTQQAYVHKHKEEDPHLEKLKEVRKNCGLREVPVKEALIAMNAAGGDAGQLNLEHFLAVYDELLAVHGIVSPGKDVQMSVFHIFDRDSNGVVDR